MSLLRTLFDYQRFAQNPVLEAQIQLTADKYCSSAQGIPDNLLDLAAAGEITQNRPFNTGGTKNDNS